MGIVIKEIGGLPEVAVIAEGGTFHKAGVVIGDILSHVNGVSVRDMPPSGTTDYRMVLLCSAFSFSKFSYYLVALATSVSVQVQVEVVSESFSGNSVVTISIRLIYQILLNLFCAWQLMFVCGVPFEQWFGRCN